MEGQVDYNTSLHRNMSKDSKQEIQLETAKVGHKANEQDAIEIDRERRKREKIWLE